MKAERRHELQQNALAKVIKDAPQAWQQYGGRLLLVLVAVLLIVFLIRYQINTNRENTQRARESLALARQMIDQLRAAHPLFSPGTPAQLASTRRQSAKDAEDAIQAIIGLADDPTITAEALVARGDLNWVLATMPELPGATTQPTLKFDRDEKELLDLAAESYNAVLTQFPAQSASVIAARFGLGAIAENRGNWDEAREQYEIIEKNENLGSAYRTQARARLVSLDRWKSAPLIAPPATAPATAAMQTTQPATPGTPTTQSTLPPAPLGPTPPVEATAPATTEAAPAAATAATTTPAAPATAPTTTPAA